MLRIISGLDHSSVHTDSDRHTIECVPPSLRILCRISNAIPERRFIRNRHNFLVNELL